MKVVIPQKDRTEICVACGEPYLVKAGHLPNHHCSEDFYAQRQCLEQRVDDMYSLTKQLLPPDDMDHLDQTFHGRFFDTLVMLQGGFA